MTEPTTPSKRHVGWYPDPEGEAPLRWWDGTAWTGHTRDSYPVAGPASGPVPPPRLPFGAARWALVGQVVAFAVAEVPILLLHLTLRAVNIGEVVGFYLILYGILFVTCRTGAQRFGNGDLRRDLGFELRWRDSYRGFGVYWLMGLAASVAVTPFAGSRFHGTNTQVLQHARPHLYAYLVVGGIAVLAAPIFEELLFRGLLLRGLLARMPTWAAVVVQAAIFSALHYNPALGIHNVTVVAAVFAMGIALGWSAIYFRHLGPGMVGHSLRNLTAVLYLLAR